MTFTRRPALLLLIAAFTAASAASATTDLASVATVGGQLISSQELEAKSAATLKGHQEAYEQQLKELQLGFARERQIYLERQVRELIDVRVLELESRSKKTTPEKLLAALKPAEVSEAQMRATYEANKGQSRQTYEAVAPQIKAYLQKQADESARSSYLATLRSKYKAMVTLPPLREEVAPTGPEIGPANAAVTIVEFADFQCPFCGKYDPVLHSVLAKYPNQVRLIYRHMPLTNVHKDAQKAAEAAVCAQNQGKFWELHDLMYAEQSSLNVVALKEKARRLGIDATVFDDCLDQGKAVEAVQRDVQAAEALGLGSTPVTFVNGRFLSGEQPLEELSSMIEEELQKRDLTAHR